MNTFTNTPKDIKKSVEQLEGEYEWLRRELLKEVSFKRLQKLRQKSKILNIQLDKIEADVFTIYTGLV